MGEKILIWILIVVGAGLFVSLLAFVRPWIERRRRETVQAFAEAQGFSYFAKERSDFWRRLVRILGCDQPFFGRVKNIIRGVHRDRDLIGCDISYRQPRASASRRRPAFRRGDEDNWLSACVCRLDSRFPRLLVCEKGLFQRLLDTLGSGQVELQPEEFRTQFHVACREPGFAREVLHPGMIQWLLQHPGWRFTVNDDLVIVTDNNRWTPDEYLEALDVTTGFLDHIPDSVREKYCGKAGA
ncbi:MAG TPA: hypothetical protein VMZ92_08455 [Planctomycetota bacterium]|nr:hypothetical protein [Planctomycetota bacterium]